MRIDQRSAEPRSLKGQTSMSSPHGWRDAGGIAAWRGGSCRRLSGQSSSARSRSCRDSRPRTSGSCRGGGRRGPGAWHRRRPRCRSWRSGPGRRRGRHRRSPRPEAMPCSLLAKKVVPRGTCAATAAVTSGCAWPTSMGPEPMQEIDILVAADVPDPAAAAVADDGIDGDIAEAAARHDAPGERGQAGLGGGTAGWQVRGYAAWWHVHCYLFPAADPRQHDG